MRMRVARGEPVTHPRQSFEQRAGNLGCVPALPEGWKREEANEIIDAALKPLDLLSRVFGRGFHLSQIQEAALTLTWCVVRGTRAETHRAAQRTGSAEVFLQ